MADSLGFGFVRWKKFLRPKLLDEDDKIPTLWRAAAAEFVGVMIFVFLSAGSVVGVQIVEGAGGGFGSSGLIGICMGHGFAIAVAIYAIGEVSGGHINPAVTFAVVLTGRLSLVRGIIYVAAQIVGAITGAALLRSLLPDQLIFNLGCHQLTANWDAGRGFGAELVMTFIFVFVVFATAISPFVGKIAPMSGGGHDYGPGKLVPLALGLTIFCLHAVGVVFTGTSVNPARSFGAAVINGPPCWTNHWVYWVGPFAGSAIAATLSTWLFLSNPTSVKEALLSSRGQAMSDVVLPEAYQGGDLPSSVSAGQSSGIEMTTKS